MKGNPFTLPELGVGLRGVRPIPSVREGVKLRLARLAGSLAEQDIVIRTGIERRVEINEINAGVGKHLRVAQPLEIVTEKEVVHWELDLTTQAQRRRAGGVGLPTGT